MKMTRVVVIFFCINICASYKRSMKEVERFINKWNWDVECWGKTNVIKQRALIQAATKQCMETPGIETTGQSPGKVPPLFQCLEFGLSLQVWSQEEKGQGNG